MWAEVHGVRWSSTALTPGTFSAVILERTSLVVRLDDPLKVYHAALDPDVEEMGPGLAVKVAGELMTGRVE